MSAKSVGIASLEKTVDPKRITVIPTAHRPELLALCLERLAVARNRPEVHIYADHVSHERLSEIEWVRDTYLPEAFLLFAKTHINVPSGCWNILNAINEGGKVADEVYLVEEDVMVYPYFYEWHATQRHAAVSCGRKIPRFDLYTNPGTCFRRPLLDLLRPHVNDEYFADTAAYCEKHFAPVHISTLDDGLIRRILQEKGLIWTFPERPVCAHQGFRGLGKFHTHMVEGKTLPERIESVRNVIARTDPTDRYTQDFEPFNP